MSIHDAHSVRDAHINGEINMIRITKDGRLNQRDAAKATSNELSDARDFILGRWDDKDYESRVEAAIERIEWAVHDGTLLDTNEVY